MRATKRPIVVKIGTNVITKPDGRPDDPSMRSIVAQVSELTNHSTPVILVTSGAVGFGRLIAADAQRHPATDVEERQLFAATGQVRLMQRYFELFEREDHHVAQVLATKHDFQDEAHYRNMQRCFTTLMRHGVVPIVNENDAVSVSELMFTDNDELAGLVSTMVSASRLIMLTTVEGVFTTDPAQPGAMLLAEISADTASPAIDTRGRSNSGRGGMESKLAIAQRVARVGIEAHIVNGRTPNVIGAVASGVAIGTRVPALKHRSGAQRRLAFATDRAVATIVLNAGAVARIRRGAASVLPVGVTNVTGSCARGEVVRIVDDDGALIGIGRAEYNARVLRGTLGQQRQKPFIRYEYLVLYPA